MMMKVADADLGSTLVRSALAACSRRMTDPNPAGNAVDSTEQTTLVDLISAHPSPGNYCPEPDVVGMSAIVVTLIIGAITDTGRPEHRQTREQLVDALLSKCGWTLPEAARFALAGTGYVTGRSPAEHAHLATARVTCRDYLFD